MDRFYNSKRQSTASYIDIFKACRLCGSGGGYKMPIIQNISDDDNVIEVEAELKQKIKECVSILVQSDDRMPPLICELCVDKVNDFFEFREMCKSTNTRVRALLGLPPQNMTQETSEDCILGVSGPVFNSAKNEVESILSTKKSSKSRKDAIKEKPSSKKSSSPTLASLIVERKTRSAPAPPPPPVDIRTTRKRKQEPPAPAPKRIRFTAPAAPPRSSSPDYLVRKDRRGSATITPPAKHSKAAKEKDSAAGLNAAKKAAASSPYPCTICYAGFAKPLALKQHCTTTHTVSVIDARLGCSSCRKTFNTTKETESHHRWHRTSNTFYNCDRCSADFRAVQGFTSHFTLKQCIPERIVPDVTCGQCLKKFATKPWMDQHKCKGPPPKGGDCLKCLKHFSGQSQLRRHDKICKGTLLEVNPSNPHLKELRPITIRMDKCDQLLSRIKREAAGAEKEHRETVYDLSAMNVTIKTEPEDRGYENPMASNVIIKQEIKEEPPDYGYEDTGFGDNYSSGSDTETFPRPNLVLNPFARRSKTQVDSLSVISLRSIFSDKMVKKKKKPKKKKIIKLEPTDAAYDAFNALYEMQEAGADTPNATESVANETRNESGDFWANEARSSGIDNDTTDGQVEGGTAGEKEGDIAVSNDDSGKEKDLEDVGQKDDADKETSNSEELPASVDKESGDAGMDVDVTPAVSDDVSSSEQCTENGPVKENEAESNRDVADPSVDDLLLDDAVLTLANKEKARIEDDDDDLDFDPFASLQGDLPASVLKNRGAFKMAASFIGADKPKESVDGVSDNVDDELEGVKDATVGNKQLVTVADGTEGVNEDNAEISSNDEITRVLNEENELLAPVQNDESVKLTSETDPNDEIMQILNEDNAQLLTSDNGEIDENVKDSNTDNAESTRLVSEVEQNKEVTNVLNEAVENSTSEIDQNNEITPGQSADSSESAQLTPQTDQNDEIAHVAIECSAPETTQNDITQENAHPPSENDGNSVTTHDLNTDNVDSTSADGLEDVAASKDEESENKTEETCKKDGISEADVLDLVSDSGDDCNILEDTPDKAALEEQLLLDDEPQLDGAKDTEESNELRTNLDNEDELLLDDGERTLVEDTDNRDLLDSEETALLLDSDNYREVSDTSETVGNSEPTASVVSSTSVIVDGKSQVASDAGFAEKSHLTEDFVSMEIGSDDQLSDGRRVKSKGECKVMDSEKMDLDTVSDDDFDMEM